MTSPTTRIAILFQDQTITELFFHLLEAHGAEVYVLDNAERYRPGERIITEPKIYPLLSEINPEDCLLVGNKDVLKKFPTHHLSRPLTEEKIENALQHMLS